MTSTQTHHPSPHIPDCTLATACFCLHDKNEHALSVEQITENIQTLLSIPIYLVIYCDTQMLPIIQRLRAPYDHLTQYKVTTLADLWSFQYEEQVVRNRAISWPTRDKRTGPESHLLTCNKPAFVLETIHQNPFQTTKFGWIDCFAGPNMKRIAQCYTPHLLPHILSNITDKYHIQILNVCDKKYKQPENKREFYERYRYIVCGGMFTCGRDIGLKILPRLQEIFVHATAAGWGHGEEMLHLEILDEFYDDIHRSYGDYGQILDNFLRPTENLTYIYKFILCQYFQKAYYKECYDCGKTILDEINAYRISVPPTLHFQFAFLYYVATFYHKHHEAKAAADYILQLCQLHPSIRAEWDTKPAFYRDQLQFATEIPEGF